MDTNSTADGQDENKFKTRGSYEHLTNIRIVSARPFVAADAKQIPVADYDPHMSAVFVVEWDGAEYAENFIVCRRATADEYIEVVAVFALDAYNGDGVLPLMPESAKRFETLLCDWCDRLVGRVSS